MNKSSFLIVGQHAVIEALRNPNRKVLKVFLTEESKKNLLSGGGGKIRTFEDRSQRVYSPPHLTALEPLLNWRSVPFFNKASNNMRFIYFYYAIATRDLL